MQIARPLLLNQIVSPYGIAIISTVFFLVVWLFPPNLYIDLIHEPDLVFLDAETLLFFLLCVAGFIVGLLLLDFAFPSLPLLQSITPVSKLKGFPLLVPLLLTTLLTALATVQVFKATPNLLVLLLSQEGDTLKEQGGEGLGFLGWGANVQIPVIWWTFWRLSTAKLPPFRSLRERRIISWSFFIAAILVQAAFCIVRVSRGEFMPVLAGIAILHVFERIRCGKLAITALYRYLVYSVVGVVGLFSLFGLLRGTTDILGGSQQLAGYTLASYNRLTAVLRGTMLYPYGGHGIYLFNFLNSKV